MNQFLKSITLTNGAVVGGVFATITTADVSGCGTVTSVALTPPAAGITVSGSPVTGAGTFVMALANDLAALEAMAGTGLVSRTGTETYAQRTITGTANRVSVSNGDGVSANPTLDIAATYVGQTSITTLGIVTAGTWHATIVGTLYGGTGLDCSAAANGKLLIGNGSGFTLATLTAGANITITNAGGSITIAASGGGGGMTIGDPVSGGTLTEILFVDGSGNLGQSSGLTFNAGQFRTTDGTYTFSSGSGNAGNASDGSHQVYFADGNNAITVGTGNAQVQGSSGNTFKWSAGTTAPTPQTLVSLPLNVYGAGTITDLLGDPDAWVLVNIAGTDYKIPAYL